jgi:hypothetical protein
MVSRQDTGYDLDAQVFAYLPDNRSHPLRQRAFQHLVAILRDLDDVITLVKNRVTPACATSGVSSSSETLLVPRIISARNAVFPCPADSRSTDSGY